MGRYVVDSRIDSARSKHRLTPGTCEWLSNLTEYNPSGTMRSTTSRVTENSSTTALLSFPQSDARNGTAGKSQAPEI